MGVPTRVGMRQLRLLEHLLRGGINIESLKAIDRGEGNRNLNRALQSLQKTGVLKLSGDEIKLTKKGIKLVKNWNNLDLKIENRLEWDGVWRLVVYDIPLAFNAQRRYLVRRLKENGFVLIQKSVWAFPYDCKEEIAIFANKLDIASFVIYLTTDHLPKQKSLLSKFNLEQ